ncbi:hypothetical protein [Lysinibacillus capsici]|uniref:hypothetical protein n=1 Tax=Lysinibacillus capsici TaxID=2115968 RepID=UPI0034E4DE10
MIHKELRININHKLDLEKEALNKYSEDLRRSFEEITIKGNSILVVKEEYIILLNKNHVEFRFKESYKNKENIVNTVIEILGINKEIEEVVFGILGEVPYKHENLNQLFKSVPLNIETEILGLKLIENNITYYISLTDLQAEDYNRKCLVKTKFKGMQAIDISKKIDEFINIVLNDISKSINEFLKE